MKLARPVTPVATCACAICSRQRPLVLLDRSWLWLPRRMLLARLCSSFHAVLLCLPMGLLMLLMWHHVALLACRWAVSRL